MAKKNSKGTLGKESIKESIKLPKAISPKTKIKTKTKTKTISKEFDNCEFEIGDLVSYIPNRIPIELFGEVVNIERYSDDPNEFLITIKIDNSNDTVFDSMCHFKKIKEIPKIK